MIDQGDLGSIHSLDKDSLTAVSELIIESMDIEFSRVIGEKQQMIVFDFLHRLYLSTDLYSFFLPINLVNLSHEIYESEVLRDFILNLSERVSIGLAYRDFNLTYLINSIVVATCRNKMNPRGNHKSLIPEQINQTIYVDQDHVRACLKDNFWLLITYLMIKEFNTSQVFHSSNKPNTET